MTCRWEEYSLDGAIDRFQSVEAMASCSQQHSPSKARRYAGTTAATAATGAPRPPAPRQGAAASTKGRARGAEAAAAAKTARAARRRAARAAVAASPKTRGSTEAPLELRRE